MTKLYERTVAELMVDAAAEIQYPATRNDFVAWFAQRYPKVKASTGPSQRWSLSTPQGGGGHRIDRT